MTSTAAMGLLRKDLLEMVGKKRTKQFLVLHGWSLGVHDATVTLQNKKYTSIEEMILDGPKLHMQQGHVYVEPRVLQVDSKNNHFYMEGIWKNSHEAEEHKKFLGIDDTPTCFTLVGYASGYLSKILGMQIIVNELKCEGKGDTHCHWIAKPIEEWEKGRNTELFNFNDRSLIKELELAYDQIKEERDNLNKSFTIHKSLTRELIEGNDLHSIATVINNTLDVPIVFEDEHFNLMAAAGLHEQEQVNINDQMKNFVQTNKEKFHEVKHEFHNEFKPAKLKIDNHHFRLMIPILLNHQITGYCSFIRPTLDFTDLEKMIIERSSVVCAMYFLNERTALEAEQRIRGNIFEEILKGRLNKREIIKMGQHVDIDFLQQFYIVVIHISLPEKTMKDEIEWKDDLMSKLSEYFKKNLIPILLTYHNNYLTLYISNVYLTYRGKTIQEMVNEIQSFCMKQYPNHLFYCGISSSGKKIESANRKFEEAVTSVNLSSKTKPIMTYEELGIIGLLIQTDNKEAIRQYSRHELKDLLDYDRRKGMDLTKTLYHYIMNGGNLEQTACSTALSISGLRYRIEKIKDILSVDIKQPTVSYPLFLAMQMLIVLGELHFESYGD